MTFNFIREMTDGDNSICYELEFFKTSSIKLVFQTFMENETSTMEKICFTRNYTNEAYR